MILPKKTHSFRLDILFPSTQPPKRTSVGEVQDAHPGKLRRTAAMMAGITDHLRSFDELFSILSRTLDRMAPSEMAGLFRAVPWLQVCSFFNQEPQMTATQRIGVLGLLVIAFLLGTNWQLVSAQAERKAGIRTFGWRQPRQTWRGRLGVSDCGTFNSLRSTIWHSAYKAVLDSEATKVISS